ncbi:restriction endonuclease subunit S [Lactiplantibacillus plantarum]|uniref:restriction endonuclease subunit S n=2 Tax=Lactiplantibacillus plantarum TaxID=1590 RepID=UPI001CA562A2|nr:restriction endonuclease subunit S [Lactiplantibacillus plantarum]QYC98579.1 restriction endonuclease subunit S [Lactiplantibacillus plantarum]
MKNENLVPKVRFKGFSDPWEQRKLGELGKIQGGGTPDSGIAEYWDGNVNWFTPTEVSNNGYLESSNRKITSLGLKKSSARLMPASTVLITSRAGVGRMGILKYPASTNQGFQSLILNSATDEYFIYSMQPIISKLANRLASGSTFTEISGKQMEKIEIMIPTTGEQTRISSLMKCINNLIAANEDKLEQLKTLKKLMMQKIFSQEWRFKGFTDPWEQRKLGELSNGFTYGLNASAKAYDGKHQYLRITDIDDETRTFKQTHLTSPDIDFIRDNSYVLKLGDIVFTRTGASTGKTFIYRTADSIVYYAGFLIKMSVREDIDSEFVFQNTLTTSFNRFVKVMSQRSGQPGINSKEYARFKLYIPKLKEQVLVGNMLLLIDNLIAANEDKLNQLKELKKYLMQNMFV